MEYPTTAPTQAPPLGAPGRPIMLLLALLTLAGPHATAAPPIGTALALEPPTSIRAPAADAPPHRGAPGVPADADADVPMVWMPPRPDRRWTNVARLRTAGVACALLGPPTAVASAALLLGAITRNLNTGTMLGGVSVVILGAACTVAGMPMILGSASAAHPLWHEVHGDTPMRGSPLRLLGMGVLAAGVLVSVVWADERGSGLLLGASYYASVGLLWAGTNQTLDALARPRLALTPTLGPERVGLTLVVTP